MGLRFAFDLGSRSLGWAIYRCELGVPQQLVNAGVRLYDDGRDPQSGESKAKDRREPRAMRRARDRELQRRRFVMKELIACGLMPKDEMERKKLVTLNPYQLRAQVIKEAVPLHHVGRAIFHINQRRGFKSNRKTDKRDENGKIASAASRLQTKMSGCETLGEWLWSRQKHEDVRKRKPTRIRMDANNKDEFYEFYPLRHMLEEEFDLICERQLELNVAFPSSEKIARLRNAIFHQRPLREVKPGKCTFFPDEDRLMSAHPLAQEFVLYQKVNQLRIEDDEGWPIEISLAQRDNMISTLLSGGGLTWVQVRKVMGLSKNEGRINFEEGGDTKIEGSALAYRFRGISEKSKGPFQVEWENFSLRQKEIIVEAYKNSTSDEELLEALAQFDLDEEQEKLAISRDLPDGYLSVSRKAVDKILPELKKEVITFSTACKRAGFHHSDLRDPENFDKLPYYNEIKALKRHLGYGTNDPKEGNRDIRCGRIANPTVHIGLNQLRHVVNALMTRYGRPDEIVLELARELKLNQEKKKESSKKRDKNRKANDVRRRELEEAGFYQKGDRQRMREALQRLRLWEELGESPNDRFCPYSGKPLTSIATVMSNAVEIEHILPRSRTLDDSMANKTIAFREWNRLKRNLSPVEAARRYPEKFDFDAIRARTKNMPSNKRWRFHDDAMERFKDQDGFADRFLKETQYLGVIAHKYLKKIKPANPNQEEMQVWVTTGRLTAELRRKWGLNLGTNYKNRDDHRHHAIDACVVGVIDRPLVQRLATAAGRDEKAGVDRVLADIDEPFEGFSDQVNQTVRGVHVSHRPNHRTSGQLHEDSFLGTVDNNADNNARGELEIGNAVIRRAVTSLTPKMISQIRDLQMREQLEEVLYRAKQEAGGNKNQLEKKKLSSLLAEWSKETGTRRVRCLLQAADIEPLGYTPEGKRYKYVVPGENLYMDIVETPDGKWSAVTTSRFEANRDELEETKGRVIKPKWESVYPEAQFIMRLYKGDNVQLFDSDGQNRIKRVVILNANQNRVWLCEHFDGGVLTKRHADSDDPFRWDLATISKLKERRTRRVRIDKTGRVRTVPHGKV